MSEPDYPDFQSPQAHADRIFNTGAPLTHLHNSLASNSAGTVILSGIQFATVNLPFNQISYEIYVDLRTPGAGPDPAQIFMLWIDQASGLIVSQRVVNAWAGGNSALLANQFVLKGPTRANQLQFAVTNNGLDSITLRYNVFQSSRIFQRDYCETLFCNSIPGQTLPTFDPDNGILCAINPNIGAGTTLTRALPLYQGQCKLGILTASGAADAVVTILDSSNTIVSIGTSFVYSNQSNANGNVNDYVTLPPSQCTIGVTNNNAAAKTCRIWLLTQDY